MVNIDTVYQKVLALANKEQRGYITPQEFNLMADKAQLDLINNYFHRTKTAFLKPQNQSEASDEMEMVQEKMGWLRSEAKLTAELIANSTITELNGKVILKLPGDLYKIATLYLTAASGAAGLDANNQSTQNPSQDFDRVEVHRVDRKDLLDVKRHPLTSPSINRPVYVINDNVFEYLELHPTVAYTSTQHINGGYAPEATWETWAVTGNSSNIQGYYANIEPTNPPGFDIDDDLLTTLPGSIFRLDYYKKPKSPTWGYIIVNQKPLYNENTTHHFDLHPSEEEPLVMRILELTGVIIENPSLLQGAAQDKANTKQEQNS